MDGINVTEKSLTATIGSFQLPLPTVKKKYEMLIVGEMHVESASDRLEGGE